MTRYEGGGPNDSAGMTEMLDRVERKLQRELDRRQRHRSRAKVALTVVVGIGLFASGIAAAAVTAWPADLLNPGHGHTYNGDGTTVSVAFAVDCYTSSDSAAPSSSLQFAEVDQAQTAAAKRDPSSVCEAMDSMIDVQRAVSAEVQRLQAQGHKCGRVEANGKSWYFDSSGSPGATTMTDGTPAPSPNPDCGVATRVSVPAARSSATIVCAVAGNWAAVIPASGSSAAMLCGEHGYTVWRSHAE